jgi:hypothetical protein
VSGKYVGSSNHLKESGRSSPSSLCYLERMLLKPVRSYALRMTKITFHSGFGDNQEAGTP